MAGDIRGLAYIIGGDTIEVAGTRIRLDGIDWREGGGPLSDSSHEHGERRPVAYDRNVTLARSGIF